jgi:hypothetical protein
MNGQLKRLVVGDRSTIAGTVYGTIIVMSVLAAGAKAYEHQLWRLVVLVGVTSVVIWLAHIYAHGLAGSLTLGRRLTTSELASIARREYSVLAAAVLPVVAVALGAVGILAPRTAVRLGLWLGSPGSRLRGFDMRDSSG